MEYRNHNLLYTSSYDRGLDLLLFIWDDIKKEIPHAKLVIAYGWQTFDIITKNNPERREWKKTVEMLMNQKDIYHLGRIGKDELDKIREKCGILAYPSYFLEINCLSIIEAALKGVVPVTTTIGAIPETVKSGIFIEGNIKEKQVIEKYKQELISLMKDYKRWQELSEKVKKEARKYKIENISKEWIKVFNEPNEKIKVSVITPTIREGFWSSMAENLSGQSYHINEWIVVDDYKEDRSQIAKEIEQKYKLKIKYIRGDKALGKYKRRLGLVRANNIGWQNAEGELLIWLQDFVYLSNDGIERIVDLYRHNKDCLIAPVDIYYEIIEPNLNNKIDWFDRRKIYQFLGKEEWRNIRVKHQGLRESENPFDFELNCGAIPKKIIQELNGFWEFLDEGLGYDNTEIAYRALKRGYKLLIDDSIIVKCANLWQVIKGSPLNISGRDRLLNPPRYQFIFEMTEKGRLPLIRDEKLDEKINLLYKIPEEVKNEDCDKWIENNSKKIVELWKKEVRII
ncbi:MAG: glycosyltransferase [Candidatus Diapherotrites archaeon]|nr:glycosyltransferase [Candidatus Diapherotrites archaeon]